MHWNCCAAARSSGPSRSRATCCAAARSRTGTASGRGHLQPDADGKAISLLGRYALVTLDGASVRVHRLIQALLRDELTEEQQAGYRKRRTSSWPRPRRQTPTTRSHGRGSVNCCRTSTRNSTELPKSREPVVRDLARAMMRYLYQSGDYDSAQALTERFMEQWTRTLGRIAPTCFEPSVTSVTSRGCAAIPGVVSNHGGGLAKCQCQAGRGRSDHVVPARLIRRRHSRPWDFATGAQTGWREPALFENATGRTTRGACGCCPALPLIMALTATTAPHVVCTAGIRRMSQPSSDATTSDVLGAWIGISWTLRLMGRYQEALRCWSGAGMGLWRGSGRPRSGAPVHPAQR